MQTLVFGRCFLANEVSLCSRNQPTVLIANEKIQASKLELEFWKSCICYGELEDVPIFEYFSDEIGGAINKCNF